jgi:hypothetical protein
MATRNHSSPGGMFFSSGATERISRPSKSAPGGSETNFASLLSMRSRKTLPVRKVTSWPSARSIKVVDSRGELTRDFSGELTWLDDGFGVGPSPSPEVSPLPAWWLSPSYFSKRKLSFPVSRM